MMTQLFLSSSLFPLFYLQSQVIWVCILCRKKQELLSKTGQWINKASSPEGLIRHLGSDTRVSFLFSLFNHPHFRCWSAMWIYVGNNSIFLFPSFSSSLFNDEQATFLNPHDTSDKRPKLERARSAEKENQPLQRTGSQLRRQYSQQETSTQRRTSITASDSGVDDSYLQRSHLHSQHQTTIGSGSNADGQYLNQTPQYRNTSSSYYQSSGTYPADSDPRYYQVRKNCERARANVKQFRIAASFMFVCVCFCFPERNRRFDANTSASCSSETTKLYKPTTATAIKLYEASKISTRDATALRNARSIRKNTQKTTRWRTLPSSTEIIQQLWGGASIDAGVWRWVWRLLSYSLLLNNFSVSNFKAQSFYFLSHHKKDEQQQNPGNNLLTYLIINPIQRNTELNLEVNRNSVLKVWLYIFWFRFFDNGISFER